MSKKKPKRAKKPNRSKKPKRAKKPANPNHLATPPATPDDLHQWLSDHLDVHCPRTPMLDGHAAPFDYICHTFFDDRPGPPARAAAAPRDLVLWANRGGGKTFLGAVATLLDLVFKPGIEVRILGGSAEQSRRMMHYLTAFFDPEHQSQLATLVKGPITAGRIRLTNRSCVEILAQSHTSVRGTRVQIIRCDEVDVFKRDVWRAAQFVTRSKRCGDFFVAGRVECLSTMHKPHGIMHDIVAECAKGTRRLFKWGVLDVLERCGDEHHCNDARPQALRTSGAISLPTPPVPPTPCPLLEECQGRAKEIPPPGGHFLIADALNQKHRNSLGDWQAEMLCIRPSRTHAVLADFDPAKHVGHWNFDGHLLTPAQDGEGAHQNTGPTESHALACGMDFGIRGDAAILWAALARDAVYILDEWIGPGLTIYQHADIILSGHQTGARSEGRAPWPVPQWIGCDPAGANQDHHGKTCVNTLRERGLTVKASRAPLQEGLELLRARLRPADGSPPRLYIHQRCARLIECMTRYHYPEDKPDCLIPVKDGFDHPIDALRYLVRAIDPKGTARGGHYSA